VVLQGRIVALPGLGADPPDGQGIQALLRKQALRRQQQLVCGGIGNIHGHGVI
jgi:hypothetical protein